MYKDKMAQLQSMWPWTIEIPYYCNRGKEALMQIILVDFLFSFDLWSYVPVNNYGHVETVS